MTPQEEIELTQRETRAELLCLLLTVPIAVIIVIGIVAYKLARGDAELFFYEVIYPTLLVFGALSSFLVGRLYKKHLERKLGRRLRNSYELTSLNSWMEASEKIKGNGSS